VHDRLAVFLEYRLPREQQRVVDVLAVHDDVDRRAGPQPGIRLVQREADSNMRRGPE
jgi:hypothetical protein